MTPNGRECDYRNSSHYSSSHDVTSLKQMWMALESSFERVLSSFERFKPQALALLVHDAMGDGYISRTDRLT